MAFKLALKREKERIQSELERDVPNGNERLYVLKAPSSQSTRSDVWNHMHFVHERQEDNGARRVTFRAGPNSRDTEFVACVRCLKVWSFLPTSGTNTLKQHKCPAAAIDIKATAVANGGPVVRRERRTQGDKVSSMKNGSGDDDKKRVTVASSSPKLQAVLATFCAQDLQPFDAVDGEGFKNLIQTVLDVAFKHKGKRLLVQDLIPTSAEVRDNAVERANAGRAALKRILQAHLSTGVYAACSLNIWTDDAKDIAYVSVTVHYITDQFELADRTLCVQPIRNASHTRIMLEEEFHEALKSLGLDQFKREQFVVVSANRAGPEDVRSVYDWHPSVDHQIARCLSTVFNKSTPQQQSGRRITTPSYKYFGEAPEVFNLIDDCKELVAYFKHEDLQRRLSKSLKQENDASHWNSLHRCLASVNEALSEIIDVLMKQNRMDKIARVGEDLLRELTAFLNEFKLATLALERFNVPTIHEVVYWRHRLLAHLDVYDEAAAAQVPADSESIASLKYLIRPIVEEKFQVETIHVVAALLDPAQKHRLHKFGVSEHQIDAGYQQLKKYMKAIGSSASAAANEADSLLPLAKKQRTEPRRASIVVSQYSDDDDDGDDDDGEAATSAASLDFHVAAEFAKYLQYKVSKNERLAMLELSKQELNPIKRSDDEFQLLTWWRHVGSPAFPILSRVARSILCIPASSARSESNGSTKTTTRSQLSPSTVNDLMFLRSNRDL